MSRSLRTVLPRGPRDVVVWTVGAAAITATAAIGFLLGAGIFSAERAALNARREQALNALAQVARQTEQRPTLNRELQQFVDRTLGTDLDSTDSVLRSRLNRIGEELRLLDLSVKTDRATQRLSPAKGEFTAKGTQKQLRDETDFFELPASISGEGTTEQALRLLHRVQSEPWLKRIDRVRLDQMKGGERVRVLIELTTIFLPGKKAKADPRLSEEERAASEQSFERYRSMVNANPFRVPPAVKPEPAPAVVPAATPAAVAPQLGFPYDQWQLTGLVEGPSGVEAWVRNQTTGERRELVVGAVIGELAFLRSEGDVAEFSQGQQRFRLQVGQPLSSRVLLEAR